jgi:hypothetical protein
MLDGKAASHYQRVEPPSHYYGVPRDNTFHQKSRSLFLVIVTPHGAKIADPDGISF